MTPMRRRVLRRRLSHVLFWTLLAVMVMYLMFPFCWALRSAIVTDQVQFASG